MGRLQKLLIILLLALACITVTPPRQEARGAIVIAIIIKEAIKKVIKAVDLMIQRLQNKTSSEAANPIHFKIPQLGPVMGDIALEDKTAANRVTEINLEDVAIGQPENEDEPDTIIPSQNSVTGKGDPLIESVADLLYEIKTLVDLIAEYSSDKAETVSLFKALLLRYPHLRGTMYQQVVNHYLSEASKSQFSFDLPLAEVITWWEAETSPGK